MKHHNDCFLCAMWMWHTQHSSNGGVWIGGGWNCHPGGNDGKQRWENTFERNERKKQKGKKLGGKAFACAQKWQHDQSTLPNAPQSCHGFWVMVGILRYQIAEFRFGVILGGQLKQGREYGTKWNKQTSSHSKLPIQYSLFFKSIILARSVFCCLQCFFRLWCFWEKPTTVDVLQNKLYSEAIKCYSSEFSISSFDNGKGNLWETIFPTNKHQYVDFSQTQCVALVRAVFFFGPFWLMTPAFKKN